MASSSPEIEKNEKEGTGNYGPAIYSEDLVINEISKTGGYGGTCKTIREKIYLVGNKNDKFEKLQCTGSNSAGKTNRLITLLWNDKKVDGEFIFKKGDIIILNSEKTEIKWLKSVTIEFKSNKNLVKSIQLNIDIDSIQSYEQRSWIKFQANTTIQFLA